MPDPVKQLQAVLDEAVDKGEELGCQLAVYKDGELLCSLSAGSTSADRSKPVTENTLFPVFSVGKGIIATLIHILYEEKVLDYDDPVIRYWPGYGCGGKEATRIWHILSHRAGVYKFPADFPFEEQFNWQASTACLAAMTPLDTIGGLHHYHARSFGILAGRIAELAAGKSLDLLLKEKIFVPLGIKGIFFGLPEEKFSETAQIDANGIQSALPDFNSKKILGGLNPSSNGCMNALSIAKVYASLTSSGLRGNRLLKDETVTNATILRRTPEDVLKPGDWTKFGLGYALCGPPEDFARMFGHGGACGSEGFADKKTGLAVGFTKNRVSRNHPDHHTRNQISRILGIPERVW